MSFASKPKKVKRKGTARDLKLVHSINRRGAATITTEEVTTPRRDLQSTSSTSKQNHSSSTAKRHKLEPFDVNPIQFHLDEPNVSTKRETLVFLSHSCPKPFSDHFKGQNDYLQQFLDHEPSYLAHLLNQESPPTNLTCSSCHQEAGEYRCLDCYGKHWWCRACLLKSHSQHPFHRPQQLKDGSFEKVSLSELGYVVVLGCSSSRSSCSEDDGLFGDRQMTLVHVNGVFEHCIRFCKCLDASSEHEQLFSHRLFPSTFDRPKTAFTLEVLDHFGIDAMECKTSAQSFFQKLRRVTNNAFPDEVPVRSPLIYNSLNIYL
jgi:CxC2 like cysteine cluster associated with KDZ transposases